MQKGWMLLLLLSLLGNIIGLLAIFKAYDYRQKMIIAWSQSHEWLPEINRKYGISSHSADPVDVIFLGASITANWDLEHYFPGKRYRNMGIDGQFSSQLLLRFQHDVIDFHPRAVVIKFCEMNFSHDVPIEVMKGNIRMMAKLASANGIKPIFLTMLPVTAQKDRTRQGQSINRQVVEFNDWLSEFCAAQRCLCVEMATALAEPNGSLAASNTSDGVHPNEAGYAKMSTLLSQALSREGL